MQRKLFFKASIALLLTTALSCSTTKKVQQLTSDANTAFSNGDYTTALAGYEQLMGGEKNVSGEVYCNAGISAWELGQTEKAIDYLEKAKQLKGINPQGLIALAKAYRKLDNLSREITNLELCLERNPATLKQTATEMLFDAYVRSENWQPADSLWNNLTPQQQESLSLKTSYLKVKRKLSQTDKAVELAKGILKVDKNNTEALDFLAEYHYRRADELYVREMKAYESNKTMKQYRQLTEALKQVNTDFKIARDYFETLYKINPDKRYARYLGNIYTRFENKQKAAYWYKLAGDK